MTYNIKDSSQTDFVNLFVNLMLVKSYYYKAGLSEKARIYNDFYVSYITNN